MLDLVYNEGAKRSKGVNDMAIFRKRNGKCQYWIYFYDEGGKRRERSRSNFTTKREAQMAAAKEESKLLNNTFVVFASTRSHLNGSRRSNDRTSKSRPTTGSAAPSKTISSPSLGSID